MTLKNIDKETFVYDILQKSKYVIVNQFDGMYEVRDDYTDRNGEGDRYALINIEDDADVVVLSDYLDKPGCKINYSEAYGMPTFEIDAGGRNHIELSFLTFVRAK